MRKIIVPAAVAVLALTGTGIALASGSAASSPSYSACIKSGSLVDVKVSAKTWCPRHTTAIEWNQQGPAGERGATGPQGPTGPAASMTGAVLRYNYYPSPGIQPGGIATVECGDSDAVSETYTAISGGVALGTDGNGFPDPADLASASQSIPLAASFPGVMDWNTNSPVQGRLDGWIVQAQVGYDASDTSATVWALCVPYADFGGSAPAVQQDNNPNG